MQTFLLFERVLILQAGSVLYFGANGDAMQAFFEGLGDKARVRACVCVTCVCDVCVCDVCVCVCV